MKIAVLSGKGGTGKTLVSVNLAALKANTLYIDCDVEEPNGYLFFKPVIKNTKQIKVEIPQVDTLLCNACRKCVDFCQFNALAMIADKLMIFNEVCHSCGACFIICPQNALKPFYKNIGRIETGFSGQNEIRSGILDIGQISGVPVIKELLKDIPDSILTVIDSPPGSACTVMESIKDADYCLLVAEPSIFGAHNLQMVYELVKLFKKPFGVILNKVTEQENPSEEFCIENSINILGKIPYTAEIAKLNSDAEIIVNKDKSYADLFSGILCKIEEEIKKSNNY
jgi:MinD superfamily P-loop ATPase